MLQKPFPSLVQRTVYTINMGSRWHPELNLKVEDIRPLWEAGLSTRQISAVIGYSKSQIHKICLKGGLIRSQRDAAILRQPQKSIHWRTSRANARHSMERLLGRTLESWEHVHHIDGDYTNNTISNLQVLIDSEHYDEHWPDRHIPYEQREHRRKYKKLYNKEYTRKKKC